MDKAIGHWFEHPPLDGGEDEDTDNGTDQTVPDDDNDDIASCTSPQTAAIHTPNLKPFHPRSRGSLQSSQWTARAEDKSVSSYTVTNSLNLEHEVHTQRAFLHAPPTLPQMALTNDPATCLGTIGLVLRATVWWMIMKLYRNPSTSYC